MSHQTLKNRFCLRTFVGAFLLAFFLMPMVEGQGMVFSRLLHAQEAEDETPAVPEPLKSKKPTSRSKDFLKTAKARAASKNVTKKNTASSQAVKAGELMDAMKESLAPPAPVQAGPASTPASSAVPVTSPSLPPIAAPSLAPPAPVVRPVEEKKTLAPTPAPAVTKEKETVSASTPRKEDLLKREEKPAEKKEETKTDRPSSDPASAPLLSDMNEAPDLLGSGAPVITGVKEEPKAPIVEDKKAAEKPAPALPDVPPGFSKPRPLFSAPGDTKKRPGVRRIRALAPGPAAAAPVAEELPLREEKAEALPPMLSEKKETEVLPPVVAEPVLEKTKEEKPSIWKAAPEGSDKGQVVFSQKADAQGGAPVDDVSEKNKAMPDEAVLIHDEPSLPAVKVENPPSATVAPPVSSRLVPSSAHNPSAGPMLHASCGAANDIGTDIKPSNYLCTQGTPSVVSGHGPWQWTCKGSNGGADAACKAPLQVNGECGMANGSLSASAPAGQLCKSGKATGITGGGPWYWSCLGDSGGVVAQCVAYTLVSGRCGSAHNVATSTAPASGLCASGTETAVVGDGPWTWNCVGSGEGTTTSCTAQKKTEGLCGAAHGVGALTKPSSGLCSEGTASAVQGVGPWNWSCVGENGGMAASCTASLLTNAACGPAHGLGVGVRPAEGLCNSGSASEVAGEGPWTWTCYGENGGVRVDCMAPLKRDGVCGPAHQNGSAEKPLSGLCASGTPGPVVGSGPWQWACEGAAGGVTANCIAQPLVQPACGPAHGVSVTLAPAAGLCTEGTPTSVIGSGPFMWSCQSTHGNNTVNCMAPLQVNGECGPADSMPATTAPSAGLCHSGTASAITGAGPWIWTCQGAGGGVSTTCQAPLQQQAEEKQAPAPATAPAEVPSETAKAGNECTPSVKRWTITCQQGGYPSNYSGVIVGETQVLCPTGVERGVWLSNSCSPTTDSAPVSPSPGKLVVPPPPGLPKVMESMQDMKPLSSEDLAPPARRLSTPKFKGMGMASAEAGSGKVAGLSRILFAPSSEGLDAGSTQTLDDLVYSLEGNEKAIITLNAYAAMPADGSQQEARRLALARALSVRSYLMRKGLSSTRIDVRAVGQATDNMGEDRVDITVK